MVPRLVLACCLLALATGCLMSEQIGQPLGHGNSSIPGNDLAFHFDTQFNVILMGARSAALFGLAWWIYTAWRRTTTPTLVALTLVATAVWLGLRDYPYLKSYRIEVAPEGLTLEIPPDLDELIEWSAIEALELEGFTYSELEKPANIPFSSPGLDLELPDWKTMKITLAGGKTHTILVDELSIEHRQIFAKAIIKRTGMVKIE